MLVQAYLTARMAERSTRVGLIAVLVSVLALVVSFFIDNLDVIDIVRHMALSVFAAGIGLFLYEEKSE